jgi:hypothetical protein
MGSEPYSGTLTPSSGIVLTARRLSWGQPTEADYDVLAKMRLRGAVKYVGSQYRKQLAGLAQLRACFGRLLLTNGT